MLKLSDLYFPRIAVLERGIDMEFTHFDEQGNARMVDVTAKGETVREAVARGPHPRERGVF